MAEVSNNIQRYSGDTYPSKSTISIAKVALDISDDWRIEVRYKVPTGTVLPGGHGTAVSETVLVIDAVLTDPTKGKFNIYPHARLVGEDPLTPNDYITSEVRDKMIANNGGSEVGVPQINQVWDDDECAAAGGALNYPFYTVRLKSFDSDNCTGCYQEEQVHNVGRVLIASRWLS